MDERRASRIPGFSNGEGGQSGMAGVKPLQTSKVANAMASTVSADQKRKSDASVAVGSSKRQALMAAPGSARPSRSNTTAGAASVSIQQASSARAAPSSLPAVVEKPPVKEESWEDIAARTGDSVEFVLNKEITFTKAVKPERRATDLATFNKQLKALGKYLHITCQKLEEEVTQWKQHCDHLTARMNEEQRKYQLAEQTWTELTEQQAKNIDDIQATFRIKEQENKQLEQELAGAKAQLADREETLSTLRAQLASVKNDLASTNRQLEEQEKRVKETEERLRLSQQYTDKVQTYSTKLQDDLTKLQDQQKEFAHEKEEQQLHMVELRGKLSGLEQQLAYEREQMDKLREERESAGRDNAALRQERDRALDDALKAKADIERLRTEGGTSWEKLDKLTNDKATLESQLALQQKTIATQREELATSKSAHASAEATAALSAEQIAQLKSQVESLKAALADCERRNHEGELHRRKLHNIIQDLKGNIRVFCRVRPVSPTETADSSHDSDLSVDFPSSGDLVDRGLTLAVPGNSGQGVQKHAFAFDRVFIPGTTQEVVFDEIAELVQSALDGHKVCIFAYGQTGSGKTFTMLGKRDQPGVIPRAMHQIFESGQKLAPQGWEFNMKASMLEIYNEEIRDLLSRRKDDAKRPQVSHDSNGVTTVSDLTLVEVDRTETVDQLLAQAMDKRTVGCTALNEQSSRSHMVFTMRIDGINKETGCKVYGVLNLIDLAGSERVKESGAMGQRLKEAQAINKSLSALGDVIAALANKQEHVPFRNSKLTYLLQPCLGGDSKALMFLNVAPTREFANESLCSLRFGQKVNSCEINAPKKNIVIPRG